MSSQGSYVKLCTNSSSSWVCTSVTHWLFPLSERKPPLLKQLTFNYTASYFMGGPARAPVFQLCTINFVCKKPTGSSELHFTRPPTPTIIILWLFLFHSFYSDSSFPFTFGLTPWMWQYVIISNIPFYLSYNMFKFNISDKHFFTMWWRASVRRGKTESRPAADQQQTSSRPVSIPHCLTLLQHNVEQENYQHFSNWSWRSPSS